MFRELRRKNKALTEEQTKQLLTSARRGVLAVNGDHGYPYAIPINFLFDPDTTRIYFHGAMAGHKSDALKADDRVCFTVYGNEFYTDDDWAPCVQSAVIFGRCMPISDPERKLKMFRVLAQKYYPTEEEAEKELVKDAHAADLYEIVIEHLCGKQIREK